MIFDAQRVRALDRHAPTRTQCDIMFARMPRIGDTEARAAVPVEPRGMLHMAVQAFDLAERLQTPVFL